MTLGLWLVMLVDTACRLDTSKELRVMTTHFRWLASEQRCGFVRAWTRALYAVN